MTPLSALAIAAAGLAAGFVNVIVGSGSLITFPTLLALGYPPVLANVSNTVGLVPGSVSGVVAYRPELVGARDCSPWARRPCWGPWPVPPSCWPSRARCSGPWSRC